MKENDFMKKVVNDNLLDKERIRQNAINSSNYRAKKKFSVKKFMAIAAVVILVLVTSLITLSTVYYAPKSPATVMKTAKNYKNILSVIEDFNSRQNAFKIGNLVGNKTTAPTMDAVENDAAIVAPSDYSKTNVQNEGMDEGDIVKTDGEYIYKLNTEGLFIISANSGNLSIKSSIKIDNYVPIELYIRGDTLVLIGGIYQTVPYYYGSASGMAAPLMDCIAYMYYYKTDIRVYNIADKVAPELKRQLVIDGNYHTSRIKEDTGTLLYIVNYGFQYGNEENYIPKISDSKIEDGKEMTMPAENIYYYDDVVSYSYIIAGQIQLYTEDTASKYSAYLGLGGTLYISNENIYVATYDYRSVYKQNVFGWVSNSDIMVAQTRIVKISFINLVPTASTRIDGTVKDRYSLDEYDSYLRVATTLWGEQGSISRVYVLDKDLNRTGLIDNIAPGERIYSVRFNKTTGSLVTFQQVDPYFNLDLTDPANPKISKGLKEDGVSYYIHYLGDTSYTIGVGQMTQTVTNMYGTRVIWTGLKVSLYDNSSGEAVNIKTVVIEGSCHSELFYNPKALLYNEERGLFAFTYENWQYGANYYYSSMNQGLAVFKFDLNAEGENKLVYEKTISNLQGSVNFQNGYYNYNYDYNSFITRGVQIGDYIYTISDKYIKSYSISALEQVSSINLYEN